jgi:O-acetyl-ADP-ribose deacetylase (regulator of RNase III)
MKIVPLSDILTLTDLYKLDQLQSPSSTAVGATAKFNDKISIIQHDITQLAVDAIVNAANNSLLGGGGVDGAIHRAAGPELLEECEHLDGCDTGSAKITDAYELPCKKVIHAVGPIYSRAKREGMHTTFLQGCYTTSLNLAVNNHCRSIAFSALSTGVYGYPSGEAAKTAIQAVKSWLEEDQERAQRIDRIVFCQFMRKDQQAYEKWIPCVHFFRPRCNAES